MKSERWRRVTELFGQALALPEGEREAFLAERCDDDSDLRGQVVKLLDADEEAGDFSDFADPGAGAGGVEVPRMPGPGDVLGPYKLVREIARGGMGVVFLASRDDESFRRQVAVKLIREGQASEDARRRMHLERQVLASLDHPRIAALHDGGTTEEGLPYFVMEYVEGVRIDEYCDRNELGPEERIELFLEVCDAVEVAHRSLVVHRDIKPSNILVTAEGVPKLLDFGIAKLLKPDLLGAPDEATEKWMRVLTPGYASPEQMWGGPVTTGSDVYSLGVLLFKLLTGRLPFEPGMAGAGPLEPRAPECEPPLASEVLRPDPLARRLRGDLDAILARALRASPRHRYGTVGQLTEDLRRFASHRPVLARRGKLRYQAGKFLRRNRLVVGIATLSLAFFLVTVLQLNQVVEERQRAGYADKARNAVLGLVVGIFESADINLYQGPSLTVLEALKYAEEGLRGDGIEPETQLALSEVIGRVYLSIGQHRAAAQQFQRILELQTELHGEESLESARARSLYSQSLQHDENELAVQEGQRSVETIQAAVGEDSRELVEPLNKLVASFCYQRDFETADRWAPRALELARRWFGAESLETYEALRNYGVVLKHQKRFVEAARAYEEALAIHRSRVPESHPHMVDLLSNMASVARAAGDLHRSKRIYNEILELQRRIYPEEHPYLGRTLSNFSNVLFDLGRRDEAMEMLRNAVGILNRTASGVTMTISTEIKLALRLAHVGASAEAQRLFDDRLEVWRSKNVEEQIAELRVALARVSD